MRSLFIHHACVVVPKYHAFLCQVGGTHTALIRLTVHHGVIGLQVIGIGA